MTAGSAAMVSAVEQSASAVRASVEAWVDEHWDAGLTVREWWSRLVAAGYSYSHLPQPHGRGYSREQANAVLAALRAKGAMGPPSGQGTGLALPTIMTHGSPEQIDRFVRPIIDGSEGWCQLFSEPGAGSDLAGVQTRLSR